MAYINGRVPNGQPRYYLCRSHAVSSEELNTLASSKGLSSTEPPSLYDLSCESTFLSRQDIYYKASILPCLGCTPQHTHQYGAR